MKSLTESGGAAATHRPLKRSREEERQGDEETRRREDEETRRRGDEETRKQGDKGTGRQREFIPFSSSTHLPAFPSLLLFLVFVILWIAPLTAKAQTGVITGRVVSEDGAGMPNVTVYLSAVASDRRPTLGGTGNRTATDADGNFKFTGLAPPVYSVSAFSAKGYVPRPVPIYEREDGGYHRIGANVTLTMIKGGAITGRVTSATGEPLISVQVNVTLVRDSEGKPVRDTGGGRPR